MHRQALSTLPVLTRLNQWFVDFMGLDRAPVIKPLPDGYAEHRALPFLWDIVRSMLLGRVLLVVAAAIISQLMFSLQPYGLSKVIDSLNESLNAPGSVDDVALWVAVLFSFWIGGPFFFQLAKLINVYVIPHLRVAIKARLFQHLMGHSPHYFQDNLPGRLAQKLTQAANSGHNVMIMLSIEFVQTIILTAAACLLIGSLSTSYGVVLGIWIVFFLGSTAVIGRFGVHWSKGVQNAISKVSGRLVDTINNWDLVRGFARLDHEQEVLADTLQGEAAWARRARLFFVGMAVLHMTLGICLMIWLVTRAIADTRAGLMTVGEFTMVCSLGMHVLMMVRMFGARMVDFFGEYGALRDGIELLMRSHDLIDHLDAPKLMVDKGGIEFKNIAFTYPDGTRVFDALNLSINPGEKVGLVGASGSGKSTIIRLLTRQFAPDSGSITIDGQNIADVTLESLSEAIGEVGQVPNVFHRSVGDNIAYGAPNASKPRIWEAAEAAHCLDFIERRADGLDTLVGERGLKLSGGERQRLAIARAWLKNAPILVLDEATSSLDSHAEAIIQEALMTLMKGRTVIAIAHRLSTIVGMDRLLVLDQGRLIEEGTHGDLLRRDGAYAAFWARQTDAVRENKGADMMRMSEEAAL